MTTLSKTTTARLYRLPNLSRYMKISDDCHDDDDDDDDEVDDDYCVDLW